MEAPCYIGRNPKPDILDPRKKVGSTKPKRTIQRDLLDMPPTLETNAVHSWIWFMDVYIVLWNPQYFLPTGKLSEFSLKP